MRKQVYNSTTGKVEILKDFMASMSTEELEKYSLYRVEYQSKPNQRYYNFEEFKNFLPDQKKYVISYVSVPKDITTLKEDMISKVKKLQSKKLSEIDWYWLKKLRDNSFEIPQEIIDLDLSIRNTADRKEIEINNLTDIDAIILYEATPENIMVDELDVDLQPTGNQIASVKYVNNVTDW
jgi:hypothetical protein